MRKISSKLLEMPNELKDIQVSLFIFSKMFRPLKIIIINNKIFFFFLTFYD